MTLQLDVYRPSGDAVTQRPLVVFVHGGGFSGGSRTSAGDRGRGDDARSPGLRHRIDQLPTHTGRVLRVGSDRRVLDRHHAGQGGRSGGRGLPPIPGDHATASIAAGSPSAGTSAGAITAANVAFSSTDSPTTAVPRPRCRSRGPTSSPCRTPATRPCSCSTGPPTRSCPTRGRRPRWRRPPIAGVRAVLTSWQGDGHVPYAQAPHGDPRRPRPSAGPRSTPHLDARPRARSLRASATGGRLQLVDERRLGRSGVRRADSLLALGEERTHLDDHPPQEDGARGGDQ